MRNRFGRYVLAYMTLSTVDRFHCIDDIIIDALRRTLTRTGRLYQCLLPRQYQPSSQSGSLSRLVLVGAPRAGYHEPGNQSPRALSLRLLLLFVSTTARAASTTARANDKTKQTLDIYGGDLCRMKWRHLANRTELVRRAVDREHQDLRYIRRYREWKARRIYGRWRNDADMDGRTAESIVRDRDRLRDMYGRRNDLARCVSILERVVMTSN